MYMTNKFKFFALLILMAIPVNYAAGQDTIYASNINKYLSLDGKQLVIKYDLPYSDTTQLFDIIVRIFYNDKVIEPKNNTLTGSWGEKVKPGSEKIILWDFPNEISGSINKVTIGIVARKAIRPLADFNPVILTQKPPFEVRFENKSKNADFYAWKFGDLKSSENNLSTLETPVHKFKSAGNYNVKLTAGNSKTNTSDTIIKVVTLGKGSMQELQKLKKLRTIWAGSAIATAGIGGFCLIKSNSLYNDWKKQGTDELKKKYKTYGIIGPAVLVVSGVCISQVIIKSIKIKTVEKTMSMNLMPLNGGYVVELAWNF